jgi:PKD repeat protein
MNRRILVAVVIAVVVMAACGGFLTANYFLNQRLTITDPQELYKQTGIFFGPIATATLIPYSSPWWSSTHLSVHNSTDASLVIHLNFYNASLAPNEVDASLSGLKLMAPQGGPFSSSAPRDTVTVCESNATLAQPWQCSRVDGGAPLGGHYYGFEVIGAEVGQTYTLVLQIKYTDKVVLFQTPVTAGAESSCEAPTISFDPPIIAGLTATVNGVALPGPSCTIIGYIHWNWGDGTSSSGQFPATHTYSSSGTYNIVATVEVTDTTTGSASISVTVPSTTTSVTQCGYPTLTPGAPSIFGLTVQFNGVSLALPGSSMCSITSVSWNWGDGSSSNSWFPATHTYASPGTYTITVTAHQSDGQTASASTTVQVS